MPTYWRIILGNISDLNGTAMDAAFPVALHTRAYPRVTLKINGRIPSIPPPTTTGAVRLTLDMTPGDIPLGWYWIVRVNEQVFWVTASGLSASPGPLLTAPAAALTDVQLLDITIPSGTLFTSGFFLVEGTQLVAFSVNTVTR